MIGAGLPLGQEVRFRVRREDWSKYEVLEGRGEVWVRAVLVKLFKIDTSRLPPGVVISPGVQYAASTQTVVTAFFDDPTLKGNPTTEPMTPEEQATGGQDIPFQPLDLPFAEYITQGEKPSLVRLQAIATRVRYFPNRFNAFRDPIVIVDSQVVVSPPREARPDELA